MADLLEQMEPTLHALAEVGSRGAELEKRLTAAKARADNDHAAFETKSKDLIPRTQALIQKVTATQVDLNESFTAMTGRIKAFQDSVQALDIEAHTETQQLLEAVRSLHTEHVRLQHEVATMTGKTAKGVGDHLARAQAKLGTVPPPVTDLHSTLQTKVASAAAAHHSAVVDHTGRVGSHVVQTVVPALVGGTNTLAKDLEQHATAMREHADSKVAQLQGQTKELVSKVASAAQGMQGASNEQLLRIAKVVPDCVNEAYSVITHVSDLMDGLKIISRTAMSPLYTILDIIKKVLQILSDLENLGTQAG